MIAGYPYRAQADKSYLGAIASLLMKYPRSVALRCADPFNGVARETKFLPTPGDIIPWCEKACESLYEEAAREDRVTEQFKARDEWKNEEISPRMKAMAEAWLNRTDPIAAQLTAHNSEEAKARREAGLSRIKSANEAGFNRECKQNGIDPAKGASPALLKTLRGNIPCGMADLEH